MVQFLLMSYNISNKSTPGSLKNLPSQKSGVTLWKSKYNQGLPEEDKKIEDEYIDNLKKQIYFNILGNAMGET